MNDLPRFDLSREKVMELLGKKEICTQDIFKMRYIKKRKEWVVKMCKQGKKTKFTIYGYYDQGEKRIFLLIGEDWK